MGDVAHFFFQPNGSRGLFAGNTVLDDPVQLLYWYQPAVAYADGSQAAVPTEATHQDRGDPDASREIGYSKELRFIIRAFAVCLFCFESHLSS
jgi:hypothetical protein